MEEQLTKGQVEKIARKLAAQYGAQYQPIPYEDREKEEHWGYMGPWVFPGSHEESESDWIISWEMCPEYQWSYHELIAQLTAEVAPGFYPEAANHIAVGFYEGW